MNPEKASDKVVAPGTTVSSLGQPPEASAERISSDISHSSIKRHRKKQGIRNQSLPTTLQDVLDVDGLGQKILSQLPPRTLFNFTIVSKRWRTMINKDRNLTRCLKPYRNPAAIFVRRHDSDSGKIIFTHIPLGEVSGYGSSGGRAINRNIDLNIVPKGKNKSGMVINHSSNGLFICSSYISYERSFYLYNPTTRESKPIPRPSNDLVIAMNLAFESAKIYNIISVCQSKYGLFSLKVFAPARTILLWRTIKVNNFPSFTTYDKVLYDYGVFVDGSIYWPCYLSTGLLSFNVHDEKLVWEPDIPQPDSSSSHSRIAYFGECRGKLLMIRYGSMRGGMLDVLELRRDPTVWFIKYHVNLNVDVPFVSSPIYVLAIVPGEKEENDDRGSYLIVHILGMVLSYNFKHRNVRKLYDLDLQSFEMVSLKYLPWRYVHPYPETLLLHPQLSES